MTKDLQIWADSSKTTLSAILMQRGKREVISHASRKLLTTERHYSTIERELLSIVYAVIKFTHYVSIKKIFL